jgi:hydroxypyruvate isomerase
MTRRSIFRSALSAAAAAPLLAQPDKAKGNGFKLRYAPHIGWIRTLSIPDQMKLYAQTGFTAFEYNGLPNHSPEEISQFRKVMDELGLSMGVFVFNRGGWRATALNDRAGHANFFEDVKRGIGVHNIIRNECATACTGLRVPHLTFEQQTRNTVEALKRAADMLDKTNLTLVLEPLNEKVDHAGYFVVYIEHAAEIIATVNHPRVKILMDMYHQQISEGNIINHINYYMDQIGYFQTGDVPGRKEPGTGEMNYRNIFKAIHAKGYKGILGLEHGMSTPGEDGFRKVVEAYRQADSF